MITPSLSPQGRPLESLVQAAIAGGANVIQLRDKFASDEEFIACAKKIIRVTHAGGIPLIINDRIHVAKAAGADGVHLGQSDAGLVEARESLGALAIVGRSTHSPDQALKAEKEGFDYIGVGPVFETPTKPDYVPVGLKLVEFAAKNIRIPFVAIGGIHAENVSQVRQAGAKTVAVVRAVLDASDPKAAAEQLIQARG